jgi:peptide methionine sulfoxide reductase MsrA
MIYPVGRIQRHEIFELIAKYRQLERDINTITEETNVWNAFQQATAQHEDATEKAPLGYGY